MARQLLSALSVAHAAGVMHRDVKPSNVLLGTDDRAVLTDFGIATFQGDPKLTQTGMVMGSPGFTAPERIRGEDASPASDLWSLGATLYAAIEGHGPFEKRGGAITTMSAIINEDAPEAPTAGALGPVIAALLRREPADRPDASTAARMITEVLPQLPGRPPGFGRIRGHRAVGLVPSGPARTWPGPAGTALARARALARTGSASAASAGPRPRWISPRPSRRSPRSSLGSAAAARPAIGARRQPRRPPRPRRSRFRAARRVTLRRAAAGGRVRVPPATASGADPGSAGPAAQGPPPDFSSWYDPSPRSGAAAPPGSGSAQAPSPVTAPGLAGLGLPAACRPGALVRCRVRAAPARSGGPGRWWKIAIAALAIIGAGAGAATVVLLHQNNSGSSQGGSAGSASGSAAARSRPPRTPRRSSTRSTSRPQGRCPAGSRPISHAGRGQRDRGLQHGRADQLERVDQRLPDVPEGSGAPNTNVLIDLTPHTYPNDMLQEAQYIESAVDIPASPATSSRPGGDKYPACRAFWKFTWMDGGVRLTAIDLLFVSQTSAGPQSYALYMTAPEATFAQTRPIFDEEVETFATVPGPSTSRWPPREPTRRTASRRCP